MRIVDLEQRVQTSGSLSFVVSDGAARHFYGKDQDRRNMWTYRLTLDGAWTHHPVEHGEMFDSSKVCARVSEHEVIVISQSIAWHVTGASVAAVPLAIGDVRSALLHERDDLIGLRVGSATVDGDAAVLEITSSYREPVSTVRLGLPFHAKATLHRFSTRTGVLEATLSPPQIVEAAEDRVRRIIGPEKALWTEIENVWSDGSALVAAHVTRGKMSATISYIVGDRAILVRKRLQRKGTKDNLCHVILLRDGFLYSTSGGLIGRFTGTKFEHIDTEIYAPRFHECSDELYIFSPGNRVYRLEL